MNLKGHISGSVSIVIMCDRRILRVTTTRMTMMRVMMMRVVVIFKMMTKVLDESGVNFRTTTV